MATNPSLTLYTGLGGVNERHVAEHCRQDCATCPLAKVWLTQPKCQRQAGRFPLRWRIRNGISGLSWHSTWRITIPLLMCKEAVAEVGILESARSDVAGSLFPFPCNLLVPLLLLQALFLAQKGKNGFPRIVDFQSI